MPNMIIAFASNFLNHHQLPLANAFNDMKNVQYYFLAFSKTPQSRIDMGYDEMNDKYDFVIKAYESKYNYEKAISIIKKADIFISGHFDKYLDIRLKEGKSVYKFSERFFKTFGNKGFKYSKLYFFLSSLKHILPYRNKDVIYLAASSYLKHDINMFYKCKNIVLKWGYFPEHIQQEIVKPSLKDSIIRIIFVGRLIKWKHPDAALFALNSLPKEIRENVRLTFIGDGDMKNELNSLVDKFNLNKSVIFKGNINNKKVRDEMLASDIFLFISDYSEGWGAVLNEAMDSCCACIASKEAGSSNFLIKDGENGLLTSCYDQEKTNNLLLMLIKNQILRRKLQKNAYLTIKNSWNAEVAAKRLIDYDKGIIFEKDICSKI